MRKAQFVVIRYLKVKRSARLVRVTMLSVNARAMPFVGFWDYDMVVPSVRVQSRVPSFEEKSLVVIDFKINNLNNLGDTALDMFSANRKKYFSWEV